MFGLYKLTVSPLTESPFLDLFYLCQAHPMLSLLIKNLDIGGLLLRQHFSADCPLALTLEPGGNPGILISKWKRRNGENRRKAAPSRPNMTKRWKEHSEVIKKLYRNENKPLHEVQRIMEQQYNFKAS